EPGHRRSGGRPRRPGGAHLPPRVRLERPTRSADGGSGAPAVHGRALLDGAVAGRAAAKSSPPLPGCWFFSNHSQERANTCKIRALVQVLVGDEREELHQLLRQGRRAEYLTGLL